MGSILTKPATGYRWRVVEIVIAAVVAVAGGVIFWAWNSISNIFSFIGAAYPPAGGLVGGIWFLPGVLGGLVIRKPGAALFCELLASAGEFLAGSQYGLTALFSGLAQGLGAELVFLAFRYRNFRLPAAVLAGALAGLFCGFTDTLMPWGYYIEWETAFKIVYWLCCALSGAVLAGLLAWLATRGLARTGALSALASRKAAVEPVA